MSYLKSCQKGEDCVNVNGLNSAPDFGCFIPDGKCNYCTTMEASPSKYKGHIDGCGQRYFTTTTSKGTTYDDLISCTSARDCEQEIALFRKAYGCFEIYGLRICRRCTSKAPNDVVDGCGGVWNTTSTYHYHGDDTTTSDYDAFDKFVTSVFWIVALIVLISIIGGVMCCMGCCPGQPTRERPVYTNPVVTAGYPGYPAAYYGGQYVLVPTPYQNQFAIITSPPPAYIVDKKVPKKQEVPAPKPPPKQNAVSPAEDPAVAAPKSENNLKDIVIRLKVEVPEKS